MPTGKPSIFSLLFKCQSFLVQLEGSSNTSTPLISPWQTLLPLSKHVALFSIKRPLLRVLDNQRGGEFLHPRKMSGSFSLKEMSLRAVAFTSNSCVSELIIASHVQRTNVGKCNVPRGDWKVRFSLFIVGLSLLPMQEFQLFWALFCKSYYPPLISCSVRFIVQTVSAHFRLEECP